jgi:hypothetical protein
MRIGDLIENHHPALAGDLVEPWLGERQGLEKEALVDGIWPQPAVQNARVNHFSLDGEWLAGTPKPIQRIFGDP